MGTEHEPVRGSGSGGAEVSRKATPASVRYLLYVRKTRTCWLFEGTLKDNGYGTISRGGAGAGMVYVHRLAYELAYGAIPQGLEIDHTCNVRNCVRPDHLQVVTHGENMHLSASRRESCGNGHRWTKKSTYWKLDHRKNSYTRTCRLCHANDEQRRRDRAKTANPVR